MNRFLYGVFKALVICSFPAMLSVACSTDDQTASVRFSTSAVYIPEPATSVSIDMWTSDAASVAVFSSPAGWSVSTDLAAGKLTITSPDADDADAVESGTVTIYAYPTKGSPGIGSIFVSRSRTTDLSAEQSNCYIISKTGHYTIPVIYKGEGRESIPTASVGLIWQSADKLIQYIETDAEKASFHVAGDDQGKLVEGNALLAAYDSAGEILWTWHIWVTDYAPKAEGIYMSRNLGAFGNTHETKDEILASYGLYYQWGRKTPFAGPATYNCASAKDASLYDAGGLRVYISYVETSDETGTTAYAAAHPLIFLLGTEESGYDWLYSSHDGNLWKQTKTTDDPCPKGWRVPSKDAFTGLGIADSHTQADTEKLMMQYGWTLSDGSISSFFLGAGRRSALYGTISNVNTNDIPKPWIGCYWTSGTESDASTALYFTLDTDDASKSEFNPSAIYPRANGMQIRCVKE